MEQKNYKGFLYLLPAFLFLGFFLIYPLIDVFVYSFQENYNFASQTYTGVGLYNYQYVLRDPYFLQALKNTFLLVVITVPLSTGLNERICAMVDTLESGVVVLSPTPVQATITRAQLEAQIVKLSSYETTVGKSGEYAEARAENVRLGTEKFNHLVIRAGESVSFNKVAGKRTVANGYQQALEIAYGNYVLGTGGGICQVSSTLYNAVVNAGLTVNKRTPHAIPSSYVEKGLDATVSDDRYDFVFTNNTNSDIYIETEFVKVKGYYHSRFTIYGHPDPNGYTYKLVSQVVETIPLPEPTYEKDTTGEHAFYDDETAVKSSGREGYIVDVYLVTMDSKGLEISREKKYTDTYKASAPVYWIGVNPHETPVPDGFAPID